MANFFLVHENNPGYAHLTPRCPRAKSEGPVDTDADPTYGGMKEITSGQRKRMRIEWCPDCLNGNNRYSQRQMVETRKIESTNKYARRLYNKEFTDHPERDKYQYFFTCPTHNVEVPTNLVFAGIGQIDTRTYSFRCAACNQRHDFQTHQLRYRKVHGTPDL